MSMFRFPVKDRSKFEHRHNISNEILFLVNKVLFNLKNEASRYPIFSQKIESC